MSTNTSIERRKYNDLIAIYPVVRTDYGEEHMISMGTAVGQGKNALMFIYLLAIAPIFLFIQKG